LYGRCLWKDIGILDRPFEAGAYLKLAADQGDPDVQYRYGEYLTSGADQSKNLVDEGSRVFQIVRGARPRGRSIPLRRVS
jgi:hypothetical protein